MSFSTVRQFVSRPSGKGYSIRPDSNATSFASNAQLATWTPCSSENPRSSTLSPSVDELHDRSHQLIQVLRAVPEGGRRRFGTPGQLTTPPDRLQQRVDRLPLMRRILRHRRKDRHPNTCQRREFLVRHTTQNAAGQQAFGCVGRAPAVHQTGSGAFVRGGVVAGRGPGQQQAIDHRRKLQRQQHGDGTPIGGANDPYRTGTFRQLFTEGLDLDVPPTGTLRPVRREHLDAVRRECWMDSRRTPERRCVHGFPEAAVDQEHGHPWCGGTSFRMRSSSSLPKSLSPQVRGSSSRVCSGSSGSSSSYGLVMSPDYRVAGALRE